MSFWGRSEAEWTVSGSAELRAVESMNAAPVASLGDGEFRLHRPSGYAGLIMPLAV